MITKLQITGKLHYHRKCDFQLSKRKLGYRTLLPLTAPIVNALEPGQQHTLRCFGAHLRSFCDVSGVLCGVSEVLCGPLWSFAVFSTTASKGLQAPNLLHGRKCLQCGFHSSDNVLK